MAGYSLADATGRAGNNRCFIGKIKHGNLNGIVFFFKAFLFCSGIEFTHSNICH
jgi:hypothetical protein